MTARDLETLAEEWFHEVVRPAIREARLEDAQACLGKTVREMVSISAYGLAANKARNERGAN